ncbi:MAG: phage tail assembly protein [Synergistaceae bacterium]|nr:phage tail assembly protein [Synergistaceae bacterium]
MKVTLTRPIEHKGKPLRELDMDLDGLTGRDLLDVEQDIFRSGKILMMSDFSKLYLVRVAARAARVPFEVLEGLGARDFNALAQEVQSFLIGTGSGPESGGTALPPSSGPGTSSEG